MCFPFQLEKSLRQYGMGDLKLRSHNCTGRKEQTQVKEVHTLHLHWSAMCIRYMSPV